MHVHMLVILQDVRDVIGYAKLSASMRLKSELKGKVWARGGNFKPIRDEAHHRNTYCYILDHRGEGAWVWTYQDMEDGKR